MRHVHRVSRIFIRTWVWGALIKGHDDIRTNRALDVHHIFGAKKMRATVNVRFEFYAFLDNFSSSSGQ